MSLVERAISKMRGAAASGLESVNPLPPRKRRTIETPDELEHTSPNRRVLPIDLQKLRADGYLPEEAQDRVFAENYRQIKRPLIEKALSGAQRQAGNDPRVIMVTSSLPGEGKTFTSINLAFSLARERDVSVLLVDCDIPKPHISHILGVGSDPGLMDALVDDSRDAESLVLGTNVRGLSFLPAGVAVEGAAESLISNRMRQILATFLENDPHRLVLLDSPPLLVTSEGRAITKIAGQVVVISRSGRTPVHALRDALKLVDASQMSGVVINEGRPSLTQGLYGYGHYGAQADAKSNTR